MIKQIKMTGAQPFLCGEQTIEAKHINFLFGLNGSGKTTISRFLRKQNDQRFCQCSVDWDGGPLNCEVYNRDYVDENFGETSIPGIFTLGEEDIETKHQIESLTQEIESLNTQYDSLRGELNGTADEQGLVDNLSALETKYTKTFWGIKQKIDKEHSSLSLAISGVKGSMEQFKARLLSEKQKNRYELKEKNDLEQQCTRLFGNRVERIALFSIPSFDSLIEIESRDIFQKVIVGKEDIDISTLIKKLGNDGWFRQGISYTERSDGVCPFCQRPLEEDFMRKVEDYFDDSYINAINEIDELCRNYAALSDELSERIKALINSPSDFIKAEELQIAFQQFQLIVDENKRKILDKKASPNIIVQLGSTGEPTDAIIRILREANSGIDDYNKKIDHIKEEKTALTGRVWRYILETLSSDIETYLEEKEKLQSKVKIVNEKMERIKKAKEDKYTQLHSLEQTLTSIVPTANGINDLLKRYGMTGFSLKVNDTDKTYCFVRDDGTSALQSLSEGEKNFVTFLYFMHSLNGNQDESGHNDNKIVVIDDPVSSLDNDALFLISALLRDLFRDIYDGNSTIKQLFILSHNSYFFKEVSYKQGLNKKKTGYWMIQKVNNESRIKQYDNNPVNSTYEMLWDEVKNANADPETCNSIALSNTMRRILEHYFALLGGEDLSKIHLKFQDGERQVFKSLISWANAGSHSTFDDYSATPNLYSVERYLKVFRELFEATGQIAHYNMMMEIDKEEPENGQTENAQP